MSTLSKVFVVLVFIIALVKVGVDATLFAQRVDWKDKFVKEVNYHYQTQLVKNAEIEEKHLQIANLNEYHGILNSKIALLENESSAKSQMIANMQRLSDALQTDFQKVNANMDIFMRNLEVMTTQSTELANRIEDYRKRLAQKAASEATAMVELQYARQMSEMLEKQLGTIEENHVALARDHKRLEETMKALNDRGVDTNLVAPKKLLEAKVSAVNSEIGLVVITIGRADGVLEGNEFTIYRGGTFIAKVTIDHIDNKWSSGRVTLKKDDPRVGDDASNSILVSASKP